MRKFWKDESGLTTVEWVMISAVVMVAAFAITSVVLHGAEHLGDAVADQMTDAADDVSP
jgi:Flp pilus assembly pilin Flp